MNEESIVLYRASDDDYEFCFQVKKAAEGDLIRKTFGWDETFQREFHRKEWTEKRPDVIRLDGRPIGTVALTAGEGFMELGQFFILPEYQNRGAGSRILGGIVEKADAANEVIRLAFLRGNRAEALYRRYGFRRLRQTETLCFMERVPRKGSKQALREEVGKGR